MAYVAHSQPFLDDRSYVSILPPIPHCFDYCNYTVNLNIKLSDSSHSIFLFQDCLTIPGPVPFHIHFIVRPFQMLRGNPEIQSFHRWNDGELGMCGTCQNLGGVLSSDDTTDAGLKSPPSPWPAAGTDHPPLPSPIMEYSRIVQLFPSPALCLTWQSHPRFILSWRLLRRACPSAVISPERSWRWSSVSGLWDRDLSWDHRLDS